MDRLTQPRQPRASRPIAAKVLGISERQFSRLEAAGVLVAATPGRPGRPAVFDLAVIVPAFIRHRTGGAESPRDRRDRSQAEYVELKIAKERSRLLPRADVIREGTAFIVAVSAKLRALPSRLVRAGAIPPTAEPLVVELVADMQAEMARWRSELDLKAASDDGP
jgi:hypothetical protein